MEKSQGVESPQPEEGVNRDALDQSIKSSRDYLLSVQNGEGYWVNELEANVTISAEYIFFMHFTGRLDLIKQDKVVNYLLHKQREDGSWPLFYGGLCDINSAEIVALASSSSTQKPVSF